MDNRDQKRADQIARLLAVTAIVIRMILANLDEIRLQMHTEDEQTRERIAEDYLMVARDIFPTVEAPIELLSVIRSVLVDWVVLSDLVSLSQAGGLTSRRLDTMEELAGRLAATVEVIREVEPDLFEADE